MKKLEEIEVSSINVYYGRLLHVCQDEVKLPDGTIGVREYIRHPGAVVIIAMMPDKTLLLEHQYRYPLRQVFLEAPAGKMDPGELMEECALRELREETGYMAGRIRYMGPIHPCIGYSDEVIEVFFADELEFVGSDLDEGEFVEVTRLSPTEALELIAQGELTDAKTISALVKCLPLFDMQILPSP